MFFLRKIAMSGKCKSFLWQRSCNETLFRHITRADKQICAGITNNFCGIFFFFFTGISRQLRGRLLIALAKPDNFYLQKKEKKSFSVPILYDNKNIKDYLAALFRKKHFLDPSKSTETNREQKAFTNPFQFKQMYCC